MIYFCSDFHFGHEKEFLWKPRGFLDWQDHANTIIENYNEIVKPEDTVYILGDCVLKNDTFGIECLKQLNGKKYLAFGNHDSGARIERFQEEGIFLDIQYGYRLRESKFTFWLQHYPAMMGNYKDKSPTICLAGHTHSPDKFQNMENGCYNVALDAHNCYPVSINQILNDIKEYYKSHPMIEYIDKSPYCNLCERKEICPSRVNHALACPGFIKENKK